MQDKISDGMPDRRSEDARLAVRYFFRQMPLNATVGITQSRYMFFLFCFCVLSPNQASLGICPGADDA